MPLKEKKALFSPLRVFILAVFILTVIISYYCFWIYDDYLTNTGSLAEQIEDAVFYGNGRYLGNSLVNICLTRKQLDVFVRGTVLTGIIVLTAAVPAELNCRSFALSLLLFAGLGNLIHREITLWGHGFYNYAPPVFLLLLALMILKNYYCQGKTKYTGIKVLCLAVIGFCQQLFSENTTCIALLISIVLFVLVVKNKLPKRLSLTWLLSSAAGAFVMFALPSIMHVAHKMDSYRSFGAETLPDFFNLVFRQACICLTALSSLFIAWAVLSFMMILSLKHYTGKNRLLHSLKPLFFAVFALQPVVSLIYYFINETEIKDRIPFTNIHINDLQEKIHYAVFLFLILYVVCVVVVLILDEQIKGSRPLYLGIILLCLLSVGELLIVSIIGFRCLFLPATIISVFIVRMMNDEDLYNKPLVISAGAVGLIGLTMIAIMMHSVRDVDRVKFAYANEQLDEGKTVIELIRLPHTKWLRRPDESYVNMYYFYRGEPSEEMEYQFIDYEEYLNRTGENS